MNRRQRTIWLAIAGAAAFVLFAGAAAWLLLRRGDVYRPGEAMAGITSELSRPLPPDHPRVTFTDVTRAAGITWRNFSGTRTSQLPEDMGSGAAWGDYDSDGWVDLAIANLVGPVTMTDAERRASPARAELYRNNGDGTFTNVTDLAAIDLRGWGMAASWCDYDNDGRLDLLFTAYGRNTLYHNDGGRFTDRSAASGLGGPDGFWSGAAWGDYDRDGWLDLYVTGYVAYTMQPDVTAPGLIEVENPASINPASFKPPRSLLFHNNRDGTFTERAAAARVLNAAGRGLTPAWVDLDEDGWPDIYIGNDVSDNVFYRNRHDGTFEDITHAARVADYRSAMGIAIGDWNRDGKQDLYLTHWIAQENALYTNVPMPPGQRPSTNRGASPVIFVDEADRFGLGQTALDFVGWGTSFFDYDLDGWLDLFVTNGSTLQIREDPTKLGPMRSQLFWNKGAQEGFFEVSLVAGDFFKGVQVGRGAAFADYDRDGDVDIFVTTNGDRAFLLRNDGGTGHKWLQVEVRGGKVNTFAIGATIRVVAGGIAQVRKVGVQASYLSQNELVETFGLAQTATVDTVEVTWQNGSKQVRTGVAANQRLQFTDGEAGATGTRDASRATGSTGAAGSTPGATDRASVQRFWELIREANTKRVASDYAGALALYQQALALNPTHADALYYAGSAQLELGLYNDAAASWRKMVATDPHSARALSQLGALFLCLDPGAPFRTDSADKYLQRAHEVNKENTGPLLKLGESALLRGDRVRASELFRAVLATHQTSPEAHFYVGYLAFKAGDEAGATRSFAEARKLPPVAVVAGATNEGDTKSGAAMTAKRQRCQQLEALTADLSVGDARQVMRERYGRLDSLTAAARTRAR